jgi:hypothetical protein
MKESKNKKGFNQWFKQELKDGKVENNTSGYLGK